MLDSPRSNEKVPARRWIQFQASWHSGVAPAREKCWNSLQNKPLIKLTVISLFYCNFDTFCTNKTIPQLIRSCSTRLWLFTFQCFSSRKTNPSFWRFSLTPSYAPKRKTEKFLCENLLVSKETKKFSIFYLLAFKRQKSKILGWICCLFEKAIESIGKTAGVKKIKNRKGTVKNIEKRPKKLT